MVLCKACPSYLNLLKGEVNHEDNADNREDNARRFGGARRNKMMEKKWYNTPMNLKDEMRVRGVSRGPDPIGDVGMVE